jgi:hypothetical protein
MLWVGEDERVLRNESTGVGGANARRQTTPDRGSRNLSLNYEAAAANDGGPMHNTNR